MSRNDQRPAVVPEATIELAIQEALKNLRQAINDRVRVIKTQMVLEARDDAEIDAVATGYHDEANEHLRLIGLELRRQLSLASAGSSQTIAREH